MQTVVIIVSLFSQNDSIIWAQFWPGAPVLAQFLHHWSVVWIWVLFWFILWLKYLHFSEAHFGSPLMELFKALYILVYFGLGSAENYSPIYLLARALILVQDWLCPWSIRVQSYTAYMDDMTGNFFVLFCSTYGAQFWNVCEIVLDQSKWKPRNKLSSRSYLQRRKNNREMETTRGLDHLRMTNNLVTATCFSRVGCLLQRTLQPLS